MIEKHAIVIGGSIAGLVAGRVLAEHFERVTIVERDRLPAGPEARRGVPQARHVHILLWRGQTLLEQFFPGLQADLSQARVPQVDWIGDAYVYSFGSWMPRFPSRAVVTCLKRVSGSVCQPTPGYISWRNTR
jgi:hypothetical protein